jgi:hypothetical protein
MEYTMFSIFVYFLETKGEKKTNRYLIIEKKSTLQRIYFCNPTKTERKLLQKRCLPFRIGILKNIFLKSKLKHFFIPEYYSNFKKKNKSYQIGYKNLCCQKINRNGKKQHSFA